MIARNLLAVKLSEAGSLLGNYEKSADREAQVRFFAEKPPLVQYGLAQVYSKGLGAEVNLEIVLTWYRQGGQRKKKLN